MYTALIHTKASSRKTVCAPGSTSILLTIAPTAQWYCWGGAAVPTRPTLHGIDGGGVGDGRWFPSVFSICLFPWCAITSREGRAESTRGACNEPSLRGLRTGKLGIMYAAMI